MSRTALESLLFFAVCFTLAYGITWIIQDFKDWNRARQERHRKVREHRTRTNSAFGRGHLRVVNGDD